MQTELMPVSSPAADTSMLAVIERAARDPQVDVAKMEKLLALAEQIHKRKAECEFDAAMNAAQSEMRPVARDAENPQTRSRYASYGALDRAVRPIYAEHGFSLSFGTRSTAPDRVVVMCRVSHRAGFSRDVEIEMPADGKGAKGNDVMTKTHATGSAVSYGMRYLLKMIFNIALGEYDDDGNQASARRTPPQKAQRNPEPPAPRDAVSDPGRAAEADLAIEEEHAAQAMGKAIKGVQDKQEVAAGVLEKLAAKPTKKGGTRYGVMLDGERWFNHFDGKIQENAETLKGHKVKVVYVESQYGKDLVSIEPDLVPF